MSMTGTMIRSKHYAFQEHIDAPASVCLVSQSPQPTTLLALKQPTPPLNCSASSYISSLNGFNTTSIPSRRLATSSQQRPNSRFQLNNVFKIDTSDNRRLLFEASYPSNSLHRSEKALVGTQDAIWARFQSRGKLSLKWFSGRRN